MVGHHLLRVHPVDVVGAEDDDVVGPLVVDEVEALVDGVGRAGEPARAEALLGRHRGDVVAEQVGHPPGLGDVPVQRVRLVLGQHDDLEVAAVDQVGQREVDHAVEPAEGHRRLGPVRRQRHEALALAAGEHDREHLRSSHVPTLTTATCPGTSRYARQLRGCYSSACVRVDLLTREYPPEVYGGAGVHVEYLARSLRASLADVRVHCFGAPARRAGRDRATPSRPAWPAPTPALRTLGRRPGDGRRLRRHRPGAQPHLVRQPRRATWRSCCTACRTWSPRTAWSRCGRGRPSSSAAATRCRPGASGPRSRRPTRSSPSPPA